jgi:predicted MFS family arabinose efflux permease
MSTVLAEPGAAAPPASRRTRLLPPVLVYVGLLVAVVSSLGSPLVPTIATDYGVSLGSAQWTLTVTLLVGALAAPVIGRLGDGPWRRTVLLTVLAVVVGGSVLAALPGPFALLLVGRAGQGTGLALLPLAMSVARDHLPAEQARRTLATLSVTAVVGVGLGYPITGLIAEHLDFHAAFWLAAVLGAGAVLAVALVVPGSTDRGREPFDGLGAVLLGLGVGGLVLAISEGETWGWGSPRLVGTAVAALVFISLCTWHELRTAHPLVDLRLMRHRTVLTANVTGALAGVGMYMLMSMVIRFVQTPVSASGLGASVVVSGLVLLPMSAASFGASRLVTWLSRWVDATRMLPLGALMFAAALLVFATSRSSLWEILVVMALAGLAIGSSFSVLPRLIVRAVPGTATSSALALNQVLRTVGFSIGSALSATILTAHTVAPSTLPTPRGYTVGAVVAIALCLLTAVVSVVLGSRREPGPAAVLDADQELAVEEDADAAVAGVLAFEPDDDRRGARGVS